MIRHVQFPDELANLPLKGVEAQKIRALLLAYGTKYDFCRFYVSEDLILCETDGCFVVCDLNDVSDISELADFFRFSGFSEAFCSEKIGKMLSDALACGFKKVNLMRFCGEPLGGEEVESDPPLDKVFRIISSSFEIDYESWYTDMSHRMRHNVAKARCLGGSALMIQHDLNGEALLSQVATLPYERGHGNAARLISSVCAELSPSEVFVICEDKLLSFYEKVGFTKEANKFILYRRGE